MTDGTITLKYENGEFRSYYEGPEHPTVLHITYEEEPATRQRDSSKVHFPTDEERRFCACPKPQVSVDIVAMTKRCDLCGTECSEALLSSARVSKSDSTRKDKTDD